MAKDLDLMNRPRAAALVLILYFTVYMIYLAWRPEGEFLHWITLVGIPVRCCMAFRVWAVTEAPGMRF